MKKFLLLLCMVSLALWISGISSATTYDDTYDPSDVYLSATSGSHYITWTHNIATDQGADFYGHYGYNPAIENVVSADIRLWFHDDSYADSFEYANLEVGENILNWEVNTGFATFMITSLISLNAAGTIEATLTATGGDFYFDRSMLTAEGIVPSIPPESDPSPEPGTLIMLGSGLVGLAGYAKVKLMGRKKK